MCAPTTELERANAALDLEELNDRCVDEERGGE